MINCYKMQPLLSGVVPIFKPLKVIDHSNNLPDTKNIITAVCAYFDITERALKSSCRMRLLSDARTIAIYLIKKHKPLTTYVKLGQVFGGRDHSTMIYAIDKFNDLYNSNSDFRFNYERILCRLDTTITSEDAA